jgi:hypothetical protein
VLVAVARGDLVYTFSYAPANSRHFGAFNRIIDSFRVPWVACAHTWCR